MLQVKTKTYSLKRFDFLLKIKKERKEFRSLYVKTVARKLMIRN